MRGELGLDENGVNALDAGAIRDRCQLFRSRLLGFVRDRQLLQAVLLGEVAPGRVVDQKGSASKRVELTVKVGDATAAFKKDGTIEAKGKTVSVKGSGSVTIESDGSLTIKAGSSLSIEAGGTVKVSGAQVQLG